MELALVLLVLRSSHRGHQFSVRVRSRKERREFGNLEFLYFSYQSFLNNRYFFFFVRNSIQGSCTTSLQIFLGDCGGGEGGRE